MNLRDYIKGDRRGKEANRIEKDAMGDLFMSEALEGYDMVDSDHGGALDRIDIRLMERMDAGKRAGASAMHAPAPRRPFVNWSMAASIMIIVALGSLLVMLKGGPGGRELASTDIVGQTRTDAVIASNISFAEFASEETRLLARADARISADTQALYAGGAVQMQDNGRMRADATASYARNEPLLAAAGGAYVTLGIPESLARFYDHATENIRMQGRRVTGVVVAEFTIGSEGRPENVTIIKPLSPAADREVKRLIRTSPDWETTEGKIMVTIPFFAVLNI